MTYVPVAVMLLVLTATLKPYDAGLLRTSTGWTAPPLSSTMYVDWLKLTVVTVKKDRHSHACTYVYTLVTKAKSYKIFKKEVGIAKSKETTFGLVIRIW